MSYQSQIYNLLLIKRLLNGNRARNSHTNHRVVARAYKTHHLNMSRNGRRSGKLSVRVHTAHSIGHTVGRRTCSHIIGVKRTACTAARSNREIVYTVFNAPFLVCACNRVLEARGVGGVTGNGNAYLFKLHYSNALRNVICAVAFNSRARTI